MPTQIITYTLTLVVEREKLMNDEALRAIFKPNIEAHVLDINQHSAAGKIITVMAK